MLGDLPADNEVQPGASFAELTPVIDAGTESVDRVLPPITSPLETRPGVDGLTADAAVAPVLPPHAPTAPSAATRLNLPMVGCALAIVRALNWFVFPVRKILDLNGSTRCDCSNPQCPTVGKHPRIPWSQEATNTESGVKLLWERFPNDGIGVVTGAKSGIWVLDVDPRSGGVESLAALEKQHGKLPKTVTVLTGSKGLHFYFAYPGPEYRNTAGVLGDGLDTRGDGGYVVGPGSPHKSGQPYTFVHGPGDTAVADAPAWLLKLLMKADPNRGGASRGRPSKTEKQSLHEAPTSRSEGRALLEIMLEHPLAVWMRECPNDVSRETWRGVAQNLSCAVVDHPDLVEEAAAAFHELSSGYSKYKCEETEQVFRESVTSAQEVGPMGFEYMAQCRMPDELATPGATNLIHAARLSLHTAPASATKIDDGHQTLIDALKLGALFDPDATYSDALQREEILRAIGWLMSTDVAAFELLKHELKKVGMKAGQVSSLEKAAKAASLKTTASPTAPPSPVMTLVPTPGALPGIQAAGRQLRQIDADAREALLKSNSPPTVFRRSGLLVRISNEGANPELKDYTSATFALKLSQVADWVVTTTVEQESGPPRKKMTAVFPVKDVVSSVLGQPPIDIPELEAICTTPYLGADGQVVTEPGYSALNKLYLVPDPTLVVPSVSPVPTAVEVSDAAKLLLEEMCGDFPFVHQGDRAHNLAFQLLPFLRCINGPTPLHIFEAPVFGSGKSLLGDVGSVVTTGNSMSWRAFPPTEEELVKAIFSALRSGASYVAFDNAKGEVGGASLESALTSRFVQSRVLGSHTEGTARNRAVWALSANNVTLSPDLVRRSLRIRIDAKSEKPEEGRVFRHPDLLVWVQANRGALVHAVLTLIQNWVAKGRPVFTGPRKASFESWSDTVGGILEAAGISGFLDAATAMSTADPQRDEARDFVEAWHARFQGQAVFARQLLNQVCAPWTQATQYVPAKAPQEVEHLSTVLSAGQISSRANRLGKWCRANLDRVYGNYMIVAGPPDAHGGTGRYMLVNKPVKQTVTPTANNTKANPGQASTSPAALGVPPPAEPSPPPQLTENTDTTKEWEDWSGRELIHLPEDELPDYSKDV